MAVVGNAEEQWQGRTSSFDGGIWTRSRTWLIKTDDKTDREDIVSTATGLPAYADAHPADATCYATSINYNQLSETPTAWTATVGYTSERELNEDPKTMRCWFHGLLKSIRNQFFRTSTAMRHYEQCW
jgi:hypothetical protein